MSFSFLILLLPVLVLAPWSLQRLFEQSYRIQETLIAVDNAGIRGGQTLRALLKNLDTQNRVLEGMDRIHHQARDCVPNPYCVALDASLSATRVAMSAAMWSETVGLWALIRIRALAELVARKVTGRIAYSEVAPFQSRRCLKCGMPLGYRENRQSDLRIRVEADYPERGKVWVTAVGETLERKSQWNYRLQIAEPAMASAE